MNENNHACSSRIRIRPTSSSIIRAPSWSLGFGADVGDCDGDYDELDYGDTTSARDANQGIGLLSSSLPTTSAQAIDHHYQSKCPRINIEIPTVYLYRKDSTSSSYHVYQINIKTSANVRWSVYRRYSEFLTLHQSLKAKEPAIGKFSFPPKRRLNSKTSTIVQDRRLKLEDYMRLVSDHIVRMPLSSANSSSYQKLHDLASNGPRISSQAGSLHEISSLTDSARSENQDDQNELTEGENQVEVALTLDESNPTIECGPEACLNTESRVSGGDNLSLVDVISTTTSNSKPSARCLFYNFISPADKEQDELESGT